jgi:hypothetical protein
MGRIGMIRNPKGRRARRIPRNRQKNNIKTDLREIEWCDMD